MAEGKSTGMAWWPSLAAVSALLAMACVDGAMSSNSNVGAPAPAPAMDCTDALLGLAGCLSYVQEGSTAAKPEAACCAGLKKVVKHKVSCLCQVFQGGQDFGVSLNMTRALALPAACKVKTPPFSKCNISIPGVNGGAPAPAPAPASGEAPSAPGSTASPAGSNSATGAPSPASASHAPSPAHSAAVMFAAPSLHSIAGVAASLLAHSCLLSLDSLFI